MNKQFKKDRTGKYVLESNIKPPEGPEIAEVSAIPKGELCVKVEDISDISLPEEVLKVKKADKLAIVGFAPSWNLAPFDDKEFDVWGINELYVLAVNKRFTGWFEIHDPWSPSRNNANHHNFLKTCTIPLFMQRHYGEFPNSLEFPRKQVKNFFNQNIIIGNVGSYYTDYSNQITWMNGLAIMLGYKEIHVYGVDMAQSSEYAWQRAACQFMIGYALGAGIKVLIPKNSELCKYPRDYGWETDNYQRNLKKQRIKDVGNRIQHIENAIIEQDYYKDAFATENKRANDDYNNKINQLKLRVVKLQTMLEKNSDINRIITTMPKDMKELETKTPEILGKVAKENETVEAELKALEQDITALRTEREQVNKQHFIQMQILDLNKKNHTTSKSLHQGCLDECKHDLANNLV